MVIVMLRKNKNEKFEFFWQSVEEASERVAKWPAWKRNYRLTKYSIGFDAMGISPKPRYKAWYGGECPVDVDATVEAILSGDYLIKSTRRAGNLCWRMVGFGGDVIMYRIVGEGG